MDEKTFVIPIHAEDLLLEPAGDQFYVKDEINIDSMNDGQVSKLLDGLALRVKKGGPLTIIENESFDQLYSLLLKFPSLTQFSGSTERTFTILFSGLNGIVESTSGVLKASATQESGEAFEQHKMALKMYLFLLHWFLVQARKSPNNSGVAIKKKRAPAKGRGATTNSKKKKEGGEDNAAAGPAAWESESQKEKVLSLLVNLLELDLSALWRMTLPEEDFVNLFSKIANYYVEEPVNMKSKAIKKCLFILLSLLVRKYNQSVAVTNSLLHQLNSFEHLAVPAAELLEHIAKEEHPQLVGDVIREIGKMNPRDLARSNSGVKNVAVFLGELSDRLPHLLLPLMPVLLPHFDGESYMMRNGIIQVIGNLICKAFSNLEKGDMADRREPLMNILEDRCRDVNSFTRGKVLQTWQQLYKERAVPLSKVELLTSLTISRLQDKAAHARKNALQLLTTLLQYNPYGPSLKLSEFVTRREQLEKNIQSKKKETIQEENEEEEEEEKPEEEEEESKKSEKSLLQFLRAAETFIHQIQEAVPIVAQLLGSKNTADVLEAIEFFVTAHIFGIENAQEGLRKMMLLVWSSEANVKEKVIQAYKDLYISEDQKPLRIARHLIALTHHASLGELTSLEELLTELMTRKLIPSEVILALWECFGMRVNRATPLESRGALIVLSMVANGDPEIIRSKMNVLIQVGLGPRWKEDEYLARYTCIALQKLVPKKMKAATTTTEKTKATHNADGNSTNSTATRFHPSHPLFKRLEELVKEKDIPARMWYGAAEQAINTIYLLSEKPDQLAASIVKEMAMVIFPSLQHHDNNNNDERSMDPNDALQCSVAELSKFFFVLGHVALKQLVHIEEIQNELRRRRGDKADSKRVQQQKEQRSAIEEELGVQAAAEETEVELLQETAEREIVGKNLLGTFGALIALVAANAGKHFDDPTLRTSAVLALCKFMCVSAEFCDKHLQLLFTVLQTAPEPAVRANIAICLGDLAFRFPNLIEPYTSHIYARLRDKDMRVRKNTLMVLSHLILNDMIKVKGQISEMAVCLEDGEERIADLAKLFFLEFSRKGNAIYNILPDLIGSLSSGVHPVADTSFRSIMKYLFSFIEKDKQSESLVDKLCGRLKTAKEAEQWRSIAYCLSLLNYNDKALKKLNELSKTYQDKLSDAEFQGSFVVILNKSKKFAKPEMKEAIAELEGRINASNVIATTGEEEEEDALNQDEEGVKSNPSTTTTKKAPVSSRGGRSQRGGRKKPTTSTKKKGGRRKVEEEEEEEEGSYEESSEEEQDASSEEELLPKKKAAAAPVKAKGKKVAAPAKKGKNTRKKESEDEEEEEESSSSSESEDESEDEEEEDSSSDSESPKKKIVAPSRRGRGRR